MGVTISFAAATAIRLVRRLAKRRTIGLMEHDMDAVFAEDAPAEIRRDARVRRAYLGRMAAHVDA